MCCKSQNEKYTSTTEATDKSIDNKISEEFGVASLIGNTSEEECFSGNLLKNEISSKYIGYERTSSCEETNESTESDSDESESDLSHPAEHNSSMV